MAEDIFDSSDSVRTASPLKYVQYATLNGPLKLELGGELPQVRVAYETYGRLDHERDNAVLICHALSGDSHVAGHNAADDEGWWEIAVGPGKAIDTNKYFVVCPNILGGCRGTTGPNTLNPATGRPYGPDFPTVTIADTVEVQKRLIDLLGIDKLLSVAGGSLGGMQVLHWMVAHHQRVRSAMPVATAARLNSQSLAFDIIGRNAITQDPNFRDGNYYDLAAGQVNGIFVPEDKNFVGLAIARMIGHITYLSREAMKAKFGENRNNPRPIQSEFEKDTAVATYLAHQGHKFIERFDPNSYIVISKAMDAFDLGEDGALARNLSPVRCRTLVVSFTSDWLFSPDQSQDIVNGLLANNQRVAYCNVRSGCGHDAFLLEEDLAAYGTMMEGFLAHAANGQTPPGETAADETPAPTEHADTSIFHGKRLDYDVLEDILVDQMEVLAEAPAGDGPALQSPSVLDLGCGNGQMLLRLQQHGWPRLVGVEINQQAVVGCVRRGIDCVHADLNDGLARFRDKQFDCVLLSRTLQAVYNVTTVVEEMLRVGRRCVVSFPNFAYEPLRRMLYENGRAPQSAGLLRYHWHDTPNIRFFSIDDFRHFCREKGAVIHRLVALNTETQREVKEDPNLNADMAIFVISRE